MKKRLLSLLLAIVMVLSLLPMATLAVDVLDETKEAAEIVAELPEETEETPDDAEPVEEEVSAPVEEEPAEELSEEPAEEEVLEEPQQRTGDAPDDAVAYVTTGEGDQKAPIQASDYDNEETAEVVEEAGYFKTLQAAVAVVPTDKSETNIKLLGTVDFGTACTGVTIAANQNIVLDLAGQTIKNNPAGQTSFRKVQVQEYKNGNYVNIEGEYRYGKNANSHLITNKGTLTVNDSIGGGKILCNPEKTCVDAWYALEEDLDPDTKDAKGNYTQLKPGAEMRPGYPNGVYPGTGNYLISNQGGTLTINAGYWYLEIPNQAGSAEYCVDNSGAFTLNIHGGELSNNAGSIVRMQASKNNSYFNMDGGTIDGNGCSGVWIQYYGNLHMNISGGTIVGDDEARYALYNNSAKDSNGQMEAIISGGNFKGEDSLYLKDVNTTVTGGTFDGVVYFNDVSNNTTLSVTGGTFKGSVSANNASKYATGGTYDDVNYKQPDTYYFDTDGIAYLRYNLFTQLDANSYEKFKCIKDYEDAGYSAMSSGGYWGNVRNEAGTGYDYVLFDKVKILKNDNSVYDVIYVINNAEYGFEAGSKTAMRYIKSDLFRPVKFYGALNFFSNANEYPTYYTKTYGNTWGVRYYIDRETALQKAYSSSYIYDGYYPEDYVGGSLGTYDQFNLEGYWKQQFNCTFKGMEKGYEKYDVTPKGVIGAGAAMTAKGFTEKKNFDGSGEYLGSFDIIPLELYLGEAEVTEENKIKVKGEEVDVSGFGGGNQPTAQEAAISITELLNNSQISSFVGTGIAEATEQNFDNIIRLLQGQTEDDTAKENIANIETIKDQRVDVDLKIAAVKENADDATVTSVTMATFDVTPKIKTTVTDSKGASVTVETTIPNEDIKEPITFRIPVGSSVHADKANVYHHAKGNKPTTENYNAQEYFIGTKDIQEVGGERFIELSAKEFSYYTYELIEIEYGSAIAILDGAGNYRGYQSFTDAVAEFKSAGNENDVKIILLRDCVSGDFLGTKEITLDLNGHYLTGESTNATKVTVINTVNAGESIITLAATGVYANDVSAFVADGYDTKKTTVDNDTVFNNTAAGIFSVVVVPVPGSYTDRDSVTDGIDLYAGDTIKMDVRVYGAKFVGADVTLYYDKTNFKMIDAPSGWDGDVKIYDNNDEQGNLKGKTRFYAAKSTQGGASDYYNLNKIDNEGNMYYSLGIFEFEALPGADEAMKVAFQVEPTETGEIGRDGVTSGQEVDPVYVAGAWSQGWNSTPANQLTQDADDTHLVNALVNVRLKSMSATISGETGLVYNASARNLVKSGAGAKDSITQQAIPTPTITYAVVTKADADAETFDASTLTYTTTIPQQTNAGDYVVFYRVSKDGYITVSDRLDVSIAKKDVDLNWSCTGPMTTGDGKSEDYVSNFKVTYSENNEGGFTTPTATYTNAGGNGTIGATVTLTSFNDADPAEGTKLIKVGKYVYTATVDPNYNIKSGETAVVELEGSVIKGYTLTAKGSETEKIGNVWYDGAAHTPAQLNIAVDDPATTDVDEAATEGVTIKYHTLVPGATEWTVSDTIPEFTTAGTYQVKAVLTKDSYYDLTLDTVTFTIKSANYVVEKFDWVTGWDVVLVYTNDAVPGFTYDGAQMYDVSKLGYKYGTTKNANGTVGTQAYTHVFGLVVAGDADITKVTSSNETALDIDYSSKTGNTSGGVAWARLDVNSSESVELNDLVFVQGVYNVNETYMAQQMAIVLKSDVNGDKLVNTNDCALIKANS